MADFRRLNSRGLVLAAGLLTLAGCAGEPLDFDLRNPAFGADTTRAALGGIERRPDPDNRGVLSYPSFQVAVAERGDTITDVAARVGIDAAELARYNGIGMDAKLRRGEVVALPHRVDAPVAARGARVAAAGQTPEQIDISVLAGDAIDRAGRDAPASSTAPFQTKPEPKDPGTEPIRHKVARGETAYSIARLYGVSVRSLADWNGLGPQLTVREGQYLLVPVVSPVARVASAAPEGTSAPGAGSVLPAPPSAAKPLPEPEKIAATAIKPPSPELSEERTQASGGARLLLPVTGKIIRAYEKRVNDGVDIAAPSGTPVKAADDGTVAAITRDTEQVPILVLRHPGNLLTVYANIEGITLEKGAKVTRGQTIARVRDSSPSFLHFEVREGLDSVDPVTYVN